MFDDILPKQAIKPTFNEEKIILKANHKDSPFYINYDTTIILETFHPLFRTATDFLIAIAEPISRPKIIHEYRLTPYSLYAAACVGLTSEDILNGLETFSKNNIPSSVKSFVLKCTFSYGKVKLVVKMNRYYLKVCSSITNKIYNDEIISKCLRVEDDMMHVLNVDRVRKRCIEIDYPVIEEFDFRSCTKETLPVFEQTGEKSQGENKLSLPNRNTIVNPGEITPLNKPIIKPIVYPYYNSFAIDLKAHTLIRSYQETCLNKMFSSGVARSGIIVLPCGSGKTLVGITAICTMKHPTLILCTSSVSVEQWKAQIKQYTNVKDEEISLFTSDKKSHIGNILITTYTMLAYSGKRSREAQKIMDIISTKMWGLLVLDEVHVVPANMFRRVVGINHYTKLGLTATLVREDDRIEDLNFLIGPKLYEANWQELSTQGHIATVECIEVWCCMVGLFYKEYLSQNSRKRRVISVMNPTKIQTCDYLIRKHEALGDKIIVFSDNVFALKAYALKLQKPFIYGPISQQERMKILKQFQTNPKINTLFLSKVGDTSIDLPEATCLIQISSHFGSRRQEAQRLGRILRAKKRNDPGFKVYFYSLVSKDTDEMYYSAKRQQFLVDQGYSFRVAQNINATSEIFNTKKDQKELLLSVLMNNTEEDDEEDEWKDGKLKDIAGGEGMAYMEKKMPRGK